MQAFLDPALLSVHYGFIIFLYTPTLYFFYF